MTVKKANLIISLPGRVMLSEQECSKKVRRPVLDKKGNQIVNRKGEPVYKSVIEPDYAKTDRIRMSVYDKDTDTTEQISIYTRRCRPAQQAVSVSLECYLDYINPTIIPKTYKGTKFMWANLTETERLEFNFRELAQALGGTVESYYILK